MMGGSVMRNGEHYHDPTAGKAIGRCRKIRTLTEKDLEEMDSCRPYVPTIQGWSEAEEQEHLMVWADAMKGEYPMLARLLHIPNGGSRHPAEAVHLKRLGVRAGVPDLLLPYPANGYCGLWIEMKSKTGKVSALQKDWIEWLSSVGYKTAVCYVMDEARKVIEEYLSHDKKG